jgi:hypothetical protein
MRWVDLRDALAAIGASADLGGVATDLVLG